MGFFARLTRGSVDTNFNVHTSVRQEFTVNVPAEHAPRIAAALQEWLVSKGSGAVVDQVPRGKHVQLMFARSGGLDVNPSELAQELQRVMAQTLS